MHGGLAHDIVFRDHRKLKLMETVRRDEWIASQPVQADLASALDVESFRILAWNRHGRVAVTRVFGTMHDGGPFEKVFVGVLRTDGDLIRHYEFFDVDDAEQALARFEELCGDRGQARLGDQ